MTNDITVSVCIPTYSRLEMLMHCLRSIFAASAAKGSACCRRC